MTLTYRGNAYEPAPIQLGSDSTDRAKIKLIYRGNIYNYTPRFVNSSYYCKKGRSIEVSDPLGKDL